MPDGLVKHVGYKKCDTASQNPRSSKQRRCKQSRFTHSIQSTVSLSPESQKLQMCQRLKENPAGAFPPLATLPYHKAMQTVLPGKDPYNKTCLPVAKRMKHNPILFFNSLCSHSSRSGDKFSALRPYRRERITDR